ncbi:MAG: aminomethyl transferase family protein [Planctomycetes bacterium]|nr:aminomethyl transferase family protein [Planctomycetota bacterium]
MAIPSPFHPRTSALCRCLRWKDWAGYHAVCAYDLYPDREYYAIRHAAGLIDVTPLFKYEVRGADASAFLAHLMVKDIRKLKVGQVTYCCWCDDQGKLVDDGTVSRLADTHFRVTAAEPTLAWLTRNSGSFDVEIEESTDTLAAVALQGPFSRDILMQITDADVEHLGFFRLTPAAIDGFEAVITRTGYTGDLGYEVWAPNEHALRLWDALMDAGRAYGLQPAGLDALDVTRVEAGFIMNGVDYFSANHCLIESRKSTPYEAGLGWTVNLDREPFIGQRALKEEKKQGARRKFVGLELDWDEYERLYAKHNLPPEVCGAAWRNAVPVYGARGEHIGQATSGAWSPTLKKNLALATVNASHAKLGTVVRMEVTVEYVRHTVAAVVSKRPFFDPPRKRA